ncbi:hypothetical protein [Sphaerisporangium sp. NPDC051011]|uniref:hypothetical protein n=1 Tax=Sphaerisporangium sp. NPDC051011 TaxID=3155792 RepID=UPI003400D330
MTPTPRHVELLISPLPLAVPCRACSVCAGRVPGAECVNADPARHHEAAQVALANIQHLAHAWRDDATQRAAAATNPAERLAWLTVTKTCQDILAAYTAAPHPHEDRPANGRQTGGDGE